MNSVPETLATITATLAASSSTLPPTITQPSTTPLLSTFATVTGTPPLVTTAPAPASTSTLGTSTFSTSTPPAFSSTIEANPETASSSSTATASKAQKASLSTGTIAGIAVAGAAAAVAGFAVLFFIFCIRKKRKNKRPVSQRWSMAFPPPPPSKDQKGARGVPAPTFSPTQRYYAAPPRTEQRRSFWRKSINPADIGVAVSPGKVDQASPRSISSEKSASRLLTNSEAPSVWPAPLMNFPPPPKGIVHRTGTAVPVFDEKPIDTGAFNRNPTFSVHAPYETKLPQSQNQLTQMSYSRPINPVPRISIQAPYETRLTRLPPQSAARLQPPASSQSDRAYNTERARGAAMTGRIPLTPIYDNGNFASQGRPPPVTYRWDTPESMNQLSRPAQVPMGLNISNTMAQAAPASKESLRKSIASDSTAFEDETTPEEEIDRQLRNRMAQSYSNSQYSNKTTSRVLEGGSSPIKDLTYPQVPRPAAVSRQAERVPRPLAGQNVNTAESAPVGVTRGLSQRYQLNRAGQSYLLSETTSSSSAGVPSLLAQRRLGQQKDLRINAAASALNSRWQVSTQPIIPPLEVRKEGPLKTLQARPSLKQASPEARVTPKTNSRGDLYLTVD